MQLQHVIKLKLSSQLIGQFGHVTASASCKQPEKGECKSWTLDSGLDHGLDYGLKYGLNSRLIFKLLAMVASQDLD